MKTWIAGSILVIGLLLGRPSSTVAVLHAQTPTPPTSPSDYDQLEMCRLWVNDQQYARVLQECAGLPAVFEASDDPLNEGAARNYLGISHAGLGEYETALVYYNEALVLAHEAGDDINTAWIYNNIGVVYHNQTNYRQARDFYRQALAMWQTAEPNGHGDATSSHNLARVYASLGELQQALDYHTRALSIWYQLENRPSQVMVLADMGPIYRTLGQVDEAERVWQEALHYYQENEDLAGTGLMLSNLGLLRFDQAAYEESLTFHEEALALFLEVGDVVNQAWSLNNIGIVYWHRGDLDTAYDYYNQAMSLWPNTEDRAGLATTLENLALLEQARNNLTVAAANYVEAALLWTGYDEERAALAHYNSGVVYINQSQYAQALTATRKALTTWQDREDLLHQGWALNNIGLIYANLLDYDAAIDHYRQALAVYALVDDPVETVRTLNNLGIVYAAASSFAQSLDVFTEAVDLYAALDDQWGEANAWISLGYAYRNLNNYAAAQAAYEQSLALWTTLESVSGEAIAYSGLGDVYTARAAYRQALIHYQEARQRWQDLGYSQQEAGSLLSIGMTYQNLGDSIQAMRYFRQGLEQLGDIESLLASSGSAASASAVDADLAEHDVELAEQYADFFGQRVTSTRAVYRLIMQMMDTVEVASVASSNLSADDVSSLFAETQALFEDSFETGNEAEEALRLTINGYARGLQGDYAGAIAAFKQARDLWKSVGDLANTARVLQYLGSVAQLEAEPEDAQTYYAEALALQEEIGDRAGAAGTLSALAFLFEAQDNAGQALSYALRAVDVLESIYGELKVEALQTSFAAGAAPIYQLVVRQLLTQNRQADAFQYAERSRARTLLTLLGNQRIDPKGSEDADLIRREADLRNQIARLETDRIQLRSSDPQAEDRSRLATLEEALTATRAEYADLLTDLQLTNPEYAALVSVPPFAVEDVQAMLRADAPDTTLLVYLVDLQETVIFVVSADAFHAERVAVGDVALRQQIEALRGQMKLGLLLPDAWRKPAQTLYQWLIEPVEAYLPAANADAPSTLGIIPHDTLHYLPFGLLHSAATDSSGPLLLDNYSLFSAPSAASLAYVLARRKPMDDSLLALANPSAPGAAFLAYAEREAQTVAALYQTEAQIGGNAGEGQFKQQAGQFSIVHIAAHSDLTSESPLFSAILLGEDGVDDGRLETHEIFNLDLTMTNLVVLSACETHLGQLSRGDEIVGIERAFLRAGAPSLLSTLWSVDDVATAHFMQSFYTHLRQDQSKADALRLAQQDTRDAFPEPYFWAGMILVGAPE